MFITVFVRRLRPGKTYEGFIRAWYPDKGFGCSVQGPFLAQNVNDPTEVLTYAFLDLPDRASLDRELARVARQEAARHDRIDDVIESTAIRGVYEVTDAFDFSTDESVARGRPRYLPSP